MQSKLLTCSSRRVAGGSFTKNDVTFRGRHYGTIAHPMSSPAYSGVELAYTGGPAPIGAAGLVGLAKTERGLCTVAFGLQHAREIVGDAGAQVGVFDRHRDLEGPLEVAVRRRAPTARVGDPSCHAVHRDGCQRIGRAGRQVDGLLDELAGALHLLRLESGLSHTGDQVWQELAIADPPEMLGAVA